MSTKKKYAIATGIVALLLIIFLLYQFVFKKKPADGKCPDGRNVPDNGDCSTLPVLKDKLGNDIVTPAPTPDVNGCTQPSKYVTNSFPLAEGMKGAFVKELQTALNTQFHSQLVVDGYFGCRTLQALKKNFNIDTITQQFFNDNIAAGQVSTAAQ